MPVGRAHLRPSQLWQLPLLTASLGLFGYAAYLFIDPKPGVTFAQRIAAAEGLIRKGKPEPAIELLNKALESPKLPAADQARVMLLMAEALEKGQKLNHLSLESNHLQIIDQTLAALKLGAKPTADAYRRMGDSYQALEGHTQALESYRKAVDTDPEHTVALRRKVIDLQLAAEQPEAVEQSISELLKLHDLPNADRAWGMDRKAELLAKRGEVAEAKELLEAALKLDHDPTAQGVARYYQGYCARKLGEVAEAERLLRASLNQLKTRHPLGAEAAYLLGRISQDRKDYREAMSFYEQVIRDYPDAHAAPLARLGRGRCRILLGDDEAGLFDLHELVTYIQARPARGQYKPEVIAGLRLSSTFLADKGNLQGALELLANEQTLAGDPTPAEFFARLASVFEKRADQVEKETAGTMKAEQRAKLEEQIRALRTRAGEAYVALSRKLTLTDDKGNGEALWHGIDLYDRAGSTPQAIGALERFVADRPDDGLAPEAFLRLGRAYHATGQFDKAIAAFLHNQFRYPQSLGASKSGVPLAQAYMAKGRESYPKAEKVLLAVVENNLVITPEAEEYRLALFELAKLYYGTNRYEEAVARLEEMTQRYPNDSTTGQLVFLMADSYRKSAALLAETKDAPVPGAPGPTTLPNAAQLAAERAETTAARAERLQRAKDLFDKAVTLYQQSPPQNETDTQFQKLAHFYRADCVYDLGRYEEAIKLYSAATLRYQDDSASLAGYVQIVNAYMALGKPEEARAANERARWLLRKMPPSAFDKGRSSLPREYWDQWFQSTADSGLWARK